MIMSCLVLSGPKHTRFFAGRAQSAGAVPSRKQKLVSGSSYSSTTHQPKENHMIKGVSYMIKNLTEWDENRKDEI